MEEKKGDKCGGGETGSQLGRSSVASCVSGKQEERKSPKQIWKSDPKNLIRNSANFGVQVRKIWISGYFFLIVTVDKLDSHFFRFKKIQQV